jgi:hypothetical protein
MPAAGEAPEGLEGSASRRASQPFQVSHGVPGPVLKQGRETTLQCRLGHMPLEIRIVLRQRCVHNGTYEIRDNPWAGDFHEDLIQPLARLLLEPIPRQCRACAFADMSRELLLEVLVVLAQSHELKGPSLMVILGLATPVERS